MSPKERQFTKLIGALNPVPESATFDKLPPHVVVLPSFGLHQNQRFAFDAIVQNEADVYDHLSLVATDLGFGPNEKIVRYVGSVGLTTIHNDLLKLLSPTMRSTVRSTEGVGDDYNPYIRHQGDMVIADGDKFPIYSLQLIVKLKNGRKKVDTVFPLRGTRVKK